jgi:hypothetical protein
MARAVKSQQGKVGVRPEGKTWSSSKRTAVTTLETPLHRAFQDPAQVEDHATSYRCMEGWMSHEGGERRAICFGAGVGGSSS